ncbi:hypothetical protein GLAREA_08922 [Glarea lozoyensis ATCC 20868]|uniref:Uncharacterized protein n=1 Tax=Glarea lozoyensis (strain ATCC 20868 / MF5171) TaxID=1116229 RepID=S3DHZ5_GLAL2|nr:uncharacterized protein GLAREA_08922 [Glarea lozoyensis ATCC 20868]EPE36759.1 hypothetical protein GLAREA_08922 [Glarea lozoyensis ATCC 20868]
MYFWWFRILDAFTILSRDTTNFMGRLSLFPSQKNYRLTVNGPVLLKEFGEASEDASLAGPLLHSISSGTGQLIAFTIAITTQAKKELKAVQKTPSGILSTNLSTIPSVKTQARVATVFLQYMERLGEEITILLKEANETQQYLHSIQKHLRRAESSCKDATKKATQQLAGSQGSLNRFLRTYKEQIRDFEEHLEYLDFVNNSIEKSRNVTTVVIRDLDGVKKKLREYRDGFRRNYVWKAPIEIFIVILEKSVISFEASIADAKEMRKRNGAKLEIESG